MQINNLKEFQEKFLENLQIELNNYPNDSVDVQELKEQND